MYDIGRGRRDKESLLCGDFFVVFQLGNGLELRYSNECEAWKRCTRDVEFLVTLQ
jgi:hypothetical protein